MSIRQQYDDTCKVETHLRRAQLFCWYAMKAAIRNNDKEGSQNMANLRSQITGLMHNAYLDRRALEDGVKKEEENNA